MNTIIQASIDVINLQCIYTDSMTIHLRQNEIVYTSTQKPYKISAKHQLFVLLHGLKMGLPYWYLLGAVSTNKHANFTEVMFPGKNDTATLCTEDIISRRMI